MSTCLCCVYTFFSSHDVIVSPVVGWGQGEAAEAEHPDVAPRHVKVNCKMLLKLFHFRFAFGKNKNIFDTYPSTYLHMQLTP